MVSNASGRALANVDADALCIPKAKDLAVFLRAGRGEGVRLVNCCQSTDGSVEGLTIEVSVSVPQRPVHDIKPSETIVVGFTSDDRLPAGVFSPRPDFPYAPHTNLQTAGQWRSLCLSDQPWYEVKFDWNPARFLGRIIWWLEETAHGSLHQPDQPLEPLLFDSYSDLIIPSELRTMPRGSHRWARARHINRTAGNCTLELGELTGVPKACAEDQCAVVVMATRPMTHGLIRSTPRTLGALHELLLEGGVNVNRQLKTIFAGWNRRFNADKLKDVLPKRLVIVVRLPKRRRDGSKVETVEFRAFEALDVVGTVGARLGIGWHGSEIDDPISPAARQQSGSETGLALLNVREVFTKELARRSNGLSNTSSDPRVTAIGAGALGSPVLANLTRSGYGRLTIVDGDVLHPHNLARHALGASYVGWYKAEALASDLSKIMAEEPPVRSIVTNVLYPGGKASELEAAYQDADLILDMAASIPVSRHLVHDVISGARRASLFLNPSGKALTLLAEDAARDIPLDSLEMQFYRAIARDPGLSSLLDHPDQNRIGQTCRDISADISQDDVAMHGGMGSRSVRQLSECDGARIRTWLSDKHDNYQLVMDIDPAAPIQHTKEEWTVVLDTELLDTLARIRECRLPNETGGVLLGSCDRSRKILYVVDALPSPQDSEERKTSYIRGTEGLSEEVERIVHVTGSNLAYVGEWHSHPDGHGVEPSTHDKRLLNWIRAGMEEVGETGLMCIIGEGKQLDVYL